MPVDEPDPVAAPGRAAVGDTDGNWTSVNIVSPSSGNWTREIDRHRLHRTRLFAWTAATGKIVRQAGQRALPISPRVTLPVSTSDPCPDVAAGRSASAARANAAQLSNRSPGSFARPRSTASDRPRGIPGTRSTSAGASILVWLTIVADGVGPLRKTVPVRAPRAPSSPASTDPTTRRPATPSRSRARDSSASPPPSPSRSARLSSLPGDSVASALIRPKSPRKTFPCWSNRMFAGFTSRWT